MSVIERHPCADCGDTESTIWFERDGEWACEEVADCKDRQIENLAAQLRGAVRALKLIAAPPMGDDYSAPREYAEWLRDQAREALAAIGGQ